jgi:hypothetical protein
LLRKSNENSLFCQKIARNSDAYAFHERNLSKQLRATPILCADEVAHSYTAMCYFFNAAIDSDELLI